jgi:hypothetical protein
MALIEKAKYERDRADKAEAALAECRDMVDKSIDTTSGLLAQRDAARADAKALAEALQVYADHERMTGVTYYGTEQLARALTALAAHKEAMDA